jgi:hypothetical protein
MEAFLRVLLPRLLPAERTFDVHAFLGKADLPSKIRARPRAYARWLPEDSRLIVAIDRDDDTCRDLRNRPDAIATETTAPAATPMRARALAWATQDTTSRPAAQASLAVHLNLDSVAASPNLTALTSGYRRLAAWVPAQSSAERSRCSAGSRMGERSRSTVGVAASPYPACPGVRYVVKAPAARSSSHTSATPCRA